jgi:hypothetical protein
MGTSVECRSVKDEGKNVVLQIERDGKTNMKDELMCCTGCGKIVSIAAKYSRDTNAEYGRMNQKG